LDKTIFDMVNEFENAVDVLGCIPWDENAGAQLSNEKWRPCYENIDVQLCKPCHEKWKAKKTASE
jgi:hypothetical protein